MCCRRFPKFTAKQMADWLYKKRCNSIDEMTNLSLKIRSRLSELFVLEKEAPIFSQTSVDGTKKYLFEVGDNRYVESVYIPDKDRATLCISSQKGCKMGCKFCVTGKQGFKGNLTAQQILNQVFSIPESLSLTNIVYMGMGEPFDNFPAVLKSIQVLTSDWGVAMSPRRITVSTVGIMPVVNDFMEKTECHLAVSLHAPFGDKRSEIMPMQKPYPHTELIRMLKKYDWSGQRRLSFEYIVFKDFNDDEQSMKKLVYLLQHLRCRVNLIRFHASEGVPLEGVDMKKMIEIRDYLTSQGIITTIRASRGEDIMAACGLLAGKNTENSEQ
ncbi:MAG: 23S rRNA (adenine(2503)-C(2))-methyltransferase RlmN [Bacteroidales bacterium]|nr:23S rRNA (adenine(2503)-C(2))-methyltransferase RlmN [Bacteroidales bacterium]